MARVFLAKDLKLDRTVAIKVLHPELSETLGAQRFLDEIQIAASLQHPNILPIHDSGQVGGLLHYVMPFVEGETLAERLERAGPLSVPETIDIANDVAHALDYAHARGIVHRDIKPQNILLSSGKAIVADFGIARAMDAATEPRTQPGLAVGTPEYMSPEQAGGGPLVDGRSDVHSLACVVYEMLAGEPPFSGRTAQMVIARIMQEAVPPLRVVRPSVPPTVVASIEKALAKVPADRFQTAGEFVASLSRAMEGRDIDRRASLNVVASMLGILVIASVLAITLILRKQGTTPMSAERVLVFPMHETGFEVLRPGLGEIAALRISSALEATDPFRTEWAGGFVPGSSSHIDASVADEIARDRRARFRFDGELVEAESRASVILRLYDVVGDSLVRQFTATGGLTEDSVLHTALAAASELLPSLVETGREIDRAAFADRDLGAALLWMQGEREYRRSQFLSALRFYQRAVERDSTLSMAALKGAQAASWKNLIQEANDLLSVALARDRALPARHAYFATGLRHYQNGAADSAVTAFQLALRTDSTWSDVWMALGDVYYHLLPSPGQLDSLSEHAFGSALRHDSAFSPPRSHLAEIALRRGDSDEAARLIEPYLHQQPAATISRHIVFMLDCVRAPSTFDWQDAIDLDLDAAMQAAKALSPGASQRVCAKRGFQAIQRHENAPIGYRFAALQGLFGLFLAESKSDSAHAAVDAGVAAGIRAHSLYIFGALLGAPNFEESASEAERIAAGAAGEHYEAAQVETQWLLGLWNARFGDSTKTTAIAHNLLQQSQSTGNEQAELLSRALSAHLQDLRQASSVVDTLLRLTPNASSASLEWGISAALPFSRLLVAEELLETERYADAYAVAAGFDHPTPIMFIGFVPRSLRIRERAARELGQTDTALALERRLVSLAGGDIRDVRD